MPRHPVNHAMLLSESARVTKFLLIAAKARSRQQGDRVENLHYNPYDFANPVNQPESFAGRKSQSEDVRYYLNHARYARPIHLALTGERSAGKTSMLNMIDKQAALLGFLVVRLDLNEGDADPIQFFGRLYDSLLTAAVLDGKYGGFSGLVWKGYRALVDANKEVDDLPLNFPAHWVAAQHGTRSLSEAVLNLDLKAISAEVDKKVVIILDECDVLSQKKITLQILRNVFMNLDGYMLVIAGTPRLFPVFDDVFSPINRQFKKVSISPFENDSETRECIAQPLAQLGITPRSLIKAWPTVGDEIHQVTGGRPYEIQLLCHTMFRRVQDKLDRKMSLSVEVLDEVRMDLENRQGHDTERFSKRYSGLSDRHLTALAILRRVNDGNIDSAAIVHAVTPRDQHAPITEVEFRRQVQELIDLGIIEESDGKCTLAGDQFDEVYLRYLAASRSQRIPPWPMAPETLLAVNLGAALKPFSHLSPFLWSKEPTDSFKRDLEDQLSLVNETDDAESRAGKWSNLVIPLRRAQEAGQTSVRWATCTVAVRTLSFTSHFYVGEDVTSDTFENLPNFVAFRERVANAGGTAEVSFDELSIEGIRSLQDSLQDDSDARESVAEIYAEHGFELYWSDEYQLSYEAFCDSYSFHSTVDTATSAAFQALHTGEWEKAIEWANLADSCNTENSDARQACLAAYDRALAYLMLNRVDECLADLSKVGQHWHEGLSDLGNYLLRAKVLENDKWELVPASGALIDLSQELTKKLRG